MIGVLILLQFFGGANLSEPVRLDSIDGWQFSIPKQFKLKKETRELKNWSCKNFMELEKNFGVEVSVCSGHHSNQNWQNEIALYSGLESQNDTLYGSGYFDLVPAERLLVPQGMSGWSASVTCGRMDQAGQHSAGGVCFSGYVQLDSSGNTLAIQAGAMPDQGNISKEELSNWAKKMLLGARPMAP
jgi:hypothetical protein